MALLMVLDHLDHIPGLLPPELSALFHAITRCVGVWFAYLAVEGFLYTRSRLRYNLRLFSFRSLKIHKSSPLSCQPVSILI